jgi:predicted enzyme related to lactoylglutathione lyase
MSLVPQIGSVVVNTTDPDGLAEFWSALLDVEIARRSGPWVVWLDPQHEGGISVAVQMVDKPTEGRRRLHMDMHVDDREQAVARAINLGGSVVENHTAGEFSWTVMADPEGNEFCIAPSH